MGSKGECQLSTGGVPEYDHTFDIDGVPIGKLMEKLVSGGHVFEAAWPSSTRVADAAVFEVPSDEIDPG